MVNLSKLDALFQSDTIQPSFEYVHIILALFLFEEKQNEGLGRYRLKKELLIGSGTARSLITKLNEKINFLEVLKEENKRMGHVLTEQGKNYVQSLKEKIPFLKEEDPSKLSQILIETTNVKAYYCLVKNAGEKVNSGMEQRDAAIKVNGIGATCLIYDGDKLKFPQNIQVNGESEENLLENSLQSYFKEKIESEKQILEKGDVLVFGSGSSIQRARLAALNAALTLIK